MAFPKRRHTYSLVEIMKGQHLRSFILVLTLWANTALGQSYPTHQSTTVNDYAQVLPPNIEAEIATQLHTLKAETGVEMTLLTLDSKAPYAPNQSLEAFATGLFNNWGIGNRNTNDGVLILFLTDDRELRIELGAAYGRAWDADAQWVVDNYFIPPLANNDFIRGLQDGTTATIDSIVTPFLADQEPRGKSDEIPYWTLAFFGALSVLAFGQRMIGDQLARLRRCPNCGRRGLKQTRQTKFPASRTTNGSGIRTRRCTHCDYVDKHSYIIPQIRSNSSGGFGGGSSGGGGASGRF